MNSDHHFSPKTSERACPATGAELAPRSSDVFPMLHLMDRCREAYSKWDGFRLRLFRAWDRLIYSDNPDAKRAALIEAAESVGVDLVGLDSLNAIRSDEEHRSQCAVMTRDGS